MMTRSTPLPLSPSHGAALAHVAELRAAAEHHRLVRATRGRRVAAWPRAAAALRDRLATPLSAGRTTSARQTCPSC
jgi:hypothetical protein